ncbi:MAG: CaiB/BaiF CoA-transferase family protein [Rhodospirillales bacterium]
MKVSRAYAATRDSRRKGTHRMDQPAPAQSGSSQSGLPLSGLKVVEFSHMVMGPTCGLILADLGAEVIKVEPAPKGDNTRRLTGSGAGFFVTYNRNKRSLALDLKRPEGLALARALVAEADVLVENFRPGGMERLGLGYADLAADNPRLVYCSAKGFLPGPYEQRTALDEVVQMMGGLAYMTGLPGRPLRAGASVNDVMGGMFAALAVMAAVMERAHSGVGQEVKSALFENCAFLVGQHMVQRSVTGRSAEPMTIRQAAWAVYDVFDCAEDQQLFVGVVTDSQWHRFCAAFGLEDLAADPELATNPQRCAGRERFLPRLRRLFAAWRRDDLIETVADIGLPYAPINRPDDLFEDPHLLATGGLLDMAIPDGPDLAQPPRAQVPGLPIMLGDRRFGLRRPPPRIGQHSREILDELGLSKARIEALLTSGVVFAEADASLDATAP